VTMDQLLLALLRNNPSAFINGNVNLVRAGANVVIPTAEQAQAQSATQARLEVRAQTREFIAYRQRLAQAAPTTTTEQPAQRIQGRIEEQVEVVTPLTDQQDRLELSKGQDAQAQASEDIAQARQGEDTQQRLSELERNLEALEALAEDAKAIGDAVSPAFDPALPLVDDQEELLTLPNALTEADLEEPEKTAADQAKAVVERVIEHPATAPAALALMALLAALGVVRARRLRQSPSLKPAATNSPPKPSTAAPMAPSAPAAPAAQATADPLSEAEVYLAYGMDDQAEAMLQHALTQDPDSLLPRLRLLEIYKMRGDVLAFNTMAQEVYEMTLGQSADWETAASMGRELDPSNPLYHPMASTEAKSELNLPEDVKGLSLDLDPPLDGNKRQP
jgi:pilus assembly protein FimV